MDTHIAIIVIHDTSMNINNCSELWIVVHDSIMDIHNWIMANPYWIMESHFWIYNFNIHYCIIKSKIW